MQQVKIKKTSEILKERVKVAKKLLPKDWMKRLVLLAPEYDSIKGYFLLRNVHKTNTSHLHVTELMEKIGANYQEELTKTSKAA